MFTWRYLEASLCAPIIPRGEAVLSKNALGSSCASGHERVARQGECGANLRG